MRREQREPAILLFHIPLLLLNLLSPLLHLPPPTSPFQRAGHSPFPHSSAAAELAFSAAALAATYVAVSAVAAAFAANTMDRYLHLS